VCCHGDAASLQLPQQLMNLQQFIVYNSLELSSVIFVNENENENETKK